MHSTGLLQVVLSDLSRLVIHKLAANCYHNLQQVCKYQVATNLIFTDLLQLDEVNRLAATLLTTCSKPVKSATCSKSVAFLAVYAMTLIRVSQCYFSCVINGGPLYEFHGFFDASARLGNSLQRAFSPLPITLDLPLLD